MTPIQQLMLGVGGAKKTYMDDVFSTYLYQGNNTARSINNGINLSGEGGMVWFKGRNGSYSNHLQDTARGAGKRISSDLSDAEVTDNTTVTSFNNNGFSLGTDNLWEVNKYNTSSWTFRKAPGFFDVVTYTGDGTSGRNIAHSLGSVPGCIMVKNLDNIRNWAVYHASVGNGKYLNLNLTSDASTNTDRWNDTTPTSSVFTVGNNADTNGDGIDYVAYVFAGGESTAATARSVVFDGSGDYFNSASSTDFAFGTGDFTIECWVKWNGGNTNFVSWSDDRTNCDINTDGSINYYDGTSHQSGAGMMPVGQWTHLAWVKSGTTVTVYKNGTSINSITSTYDAGSSARSFSLGGRYNGASPYNQLNGSISNFRIVKGTAVYTSSFKPPTEPLTNITNTKLLCCNNSSVTGTTVGTVTSVGDPTASIDSPFDDPAAFTFGENEDQGIIKCGSYVGNGNDDGPEINLGWEPQWLMVKRTDSADNWPIYDSMRGIVTGGNDTRLYGNKIDTEYTSTGYLKLTPTGFKSTKSSGQFNNNGSTYIYICIRRSDGYVGKPAKLGTDVFAMDTGAGSSTMPNFDSGFPVDFALVKKTAVTQDWYTNARLSGIKYMSTNSIDAEANSSASEWITDNNVGWNAGTQYDSDYQSWMFKRHAGFDVVTYTGNGTAGRQISHSLNKIPEMIWVKRRNDDRNWGIYHKGLNGGTNPEQYAMEFSTDAEYDSSQWNDTAPTTTHFSLGTSPTGNYNGSTYIAMLFASVDGISKVGSFTGNGSTGQTITLGFQPRFLMLRQVDTDAHWYIMDTTRGWGSGDDKYLMLNATNSQGDYEFGEPASNGFTLVDGGTSNTTGKPYIYYAHA